MPRWWSSGKPASLTEGHDSAQSLTTALSLHSQDEVSGFMINDKYSYVRYLGNGGFGRVIEVEDVETGKHWAVKRLPRYSFKPYYQTEVLIQRRLNHPHIIKLHEVFLTDEYINIVMDCANDGNLFDFVRDKGCLQEGLARWFFQQLILAVDYCHSKGVASRDIKLENILLQRMPGVPQPLVRLCDFGYGKDLESEPTSAVGTFAYMAPEVMNNHQSSRRSSYDARASDLWSCGVVLYAMLMGQYPFPQELHQLPAALQAMACQNFKLPGRLSPGCRSLLLQLLHPDPRQRITVAGILQHPWLLEDLPPAALAMNERYLPLGPRCKQSEPEILAMFTQVYEEELWDDDVELPTTAAFAGCGCMRVLH